MTSSGNKIIKIDHRENSNDLLILLANKYGFEIVVEELKLDDYFIFPDIVIERKTTADFAISILDGRLFDQAFRLVNRTESPIMLLEGENFSGVCVPLHCIKGALIILAYLYRLPVLRTRNIEDSAWYMNQLSLRPERHRSAIGPSTRYNPKTPEKQKEYILRTLPRIGSKTAKIFDRAFRNDQKVVTASQKEIVKVPGIGKDTADKILSAVKKERSVYKTESP